jgi:hypothetical protein
MQHYYNTLGEDWFNYSQLYDRFARECSNDSIIVEVGSWVGRSICYLGVELVNNNKRPKVYAVDTWLGSSEHQNHDIVKRDELYTTFLKNISPLGDLITPLRLDSLAAAETFENESIDFLFLDASHHYGDVKKDIVAWYPKIKTGGIFSGHDVDGGWPGVNRAINESLELQGYTIPPPGKWFEKKK